MTESLDSLVERYQRLYLEGGIDGVAVVAADSGHCEECGRYADRVYMPSRLPRLPLAECTRPGGCRCRYEPSVTVYE